MSNGDNRSTGRNPRLVSLADEDAVKEISVDRPEPVEGRQQPHAPAAVEARAVPRRDLRLGPCPARDVRLRRSEARGDRIRLDGLRHRHRRRARPDAGRQRRRDVAGASASVGIRVELPFEQDVNPFVEQAFEHETFFTRLHHFVLASDAFVVVPGGIGTVLETLMIWQLLQVRHVHDVPLILVGKMWAGLVEWARRACWTRGCRSPARRTWISRGASTPRTRPSRSCAICTATGRRSSSAGSCLRIEQTLAALERDETRLPGRPTILAPWTRHRLSSRWAGHLAVSLEAVLIGNAAAALQGAPSTTVDFDFLFRGTRLNPAKLRDLADRLRATVLRPYIRRPACSVTRETMGYRSTS